MNASPPLDVRPDVTAALQAGRPVVALVSAPIAQTLPWPVNLETYRLMQAAVQREGGTLAMIAVWKGRLTVGLEVSEVETLTQHGVNVLRASRRDLAAAVVGGSTAATTVSASMYIAWRAGIR